MKTAGFKLVSTATSLKSQRHISPPEVAIFAPPRGSRLGYPAPTLFGLDRRNRGHRRRCGLVIQLRPTMPFPMAFVRVDKPEHWRHRTAQAFGLADA